MYRVDLNSDLGERFGAWTMGMDEEILKNVSSANVACGYHAGDPLVMERTVALAKAAGCAVGAHPGYPDLMGFGRRNLSVSPAEAKAYVKYQLGALLAFTRAAGIPMQHVKPHGAMYNMAAKDDRLAAAIAEAVAEVDGSLILLGLAGSSLLSAGKAAGLKTAGEVFADRAYQEDGTLVPRSVEGAVIHDRALAIRRTLRMVTEGTVETAAGKTIEIRADSVCVHGDNPSALAFVESIRAELTRHGVEIVPLAQIV